MRERSGGFCAERMGTMEIQSANRLRRNGQLARTEERKGSAQEPKSRLQRHREDRLAVSQQALAMLEEQNRRAREERERKRLETQMRGGSEADAVARELKKRIKCQKIAVRIQAGDKVPPQDERYLQENDPQTYQLAIALRQPKKDPKEWDTLLEDEDREGGSSENTGETDGGETPEA
jgi:hypothetical protein